MPAIARNPCRTSSSVLYSAGTLGYSSPAAAGISLWTKCSMNSRFGSSVLNATAVGIRLGI
ncbi:MAG: hypothetical protein KAI39_12445 [Desulfobulbaceae bacterium]|nr:hypothetical protein [Desulfobulbaceae bacterium]